MRRLTVAGLLAALPAYAAKPPVSLFTTQTPSMAEAADGVPYELGVRLVPAQNGRVTALRFWNTADEAGPHTGNLWADDGTLLASVTFGGEAGTGWHQAALATPVQLQAGRAYLASVNINVYYPDTLQGLGAPGVANGPLASVADGRNGVYGAPGIFPAQSYFASNYFRDIVFVPTHTQKAPPAPWAHRGYLGWIRDLASTPSAPNVYWPDIGVDDALVADYDAAARQLQNAGATEIELWGIAAAGTLNSPGYLPDVEKTASAHRRAQVLRIVAKLHEHGLKVVAGMGGMSWGFDRIVAANPSIGCSNSAYIANPRIDLAWSYQTRIIDYLMGFGVDGITVQSGDEGICAESNPDNLDAVQYHAPIVDRIATYIRSNYPGAIVGSANYGISFSNPADLPYVRQMAAHLDYVVDVGNTAQAQDPTYRARLASAIAPASLASEADPNPAAPVHFDRLSWFLPMFQNDIGALASLYRDGGRVAENYMRMAANPGDEMTADLFLRYEADPAIDVPHTLNALLTTRYKPQSQAALVQLHDIFTAAERAYFSNALSSNVLIEAYYDHGDTGRPYLRDNMTAQGRQAYRAALAGLLTEARAVQGSVGYPAQVGDIITCIQAVIAQIDALRLQQPVATANSLRQELGEMSHPPQTPRHSLERGSMNDGGLGGPARSTQLFAGLYESNARRVNIREQLVEPSGIEPLTS